MNYNIALGAEKYFNFY